MSLTTDPNDQCLRDGQKSEGQNECYLVLSEEERAKGFIRPVRNSYRHVGKKAETINEGDILLTLEELHKSDPEEYDDKRIEEFKKFGYVAYLRKKDGVPYYATFLDQAGYYAIINKKDKVGGCGAVTTMGNALSETYARNPKFYGATFCTQCNKHLPVGEFVWTGTNQEVGS